MYLTDKQYKNALKFNSNKAVKENLTTDYLLISFWISFGLTLYLLGVLNAWEII